MLFEDCFRFIRPFDRDYAAANCKQENPSCVHGSAGTQPRGCFALKPSLLIGRNQPAMALREYQGAGLSPAKGPSELCILSEVVWFSNRLHSESTVHQCAIELLTLNRIDDFGDDFLGDDELISGIVPSNAKSSA